MNPGLVPPAFAAQRQVLTLPRWPGLAAARVATPAPAVAGAGWPWPAGRPALRPVRADDADAFQQFVMRLSGPSRRMRFHGALNACSPALLKALTQPDPATHCAWVAVQRVDGQDAIVGEARFVRGDRGHEAELAIAVADAQRGRGVADRLMAVLLREAERAALALLYGDVLEGNGPMFGLLRRHGFEAQRSAGAGLVRWRRRWPARSPSSAKI